MEKHTCSCGGHHHHEEHTCSCGGHHHHEEHTCSCGGHHHHEQPKIEKRDLTKAEEKFLNTLAFFGKAPVARFVVSSTTNHDFRNAVLGPVFISNPNDDMEIIKNTSEIITNLANQGLLEIVYDTPLENYAYGEFYSSNSFKYFEKTVKEASEKENFIGDTAELEEGYIAIIK
ncbi:MAG: hypothetical protein R3Y35_05250 [Clostridia bacterium]